ncbi:MAG: hypothetical protein GX198_10350 [Epulopiscium sp.]|nr:hypothetical protein [Candidatus Epulonipiscium sp.]
MSYDDVLKKIKDDKQKANITSKLYRYTGLIHAIEFFSQKFSIDQILEFAYDFVNELILVDQIAIFYKEKNQYTLLKSKGYNIHQYSTEYTPKYDEIALFHGHILNSHALEEYLPSKVLTDFPSKLAIPLIIESELYGFILTNRFEDKPAFDEEDSIVAEALMQLFNTSLNNYKSYQSLQTAKMELDEKVFNLFAINQSSKVLLSELDLTVLYNLSIDVFAELTQSSITSFFLYDEKGENYVLRGMRDTFNPSNQLTMSVYLKNDALFDYSKSILDMSIQEDYQLFMDSFQNSKAVIKNLRPLYIVLLIKNKVLLGFVTLGKKVTDKPYNKGIFELIESLASSTYIAVSNAKYFKETNEQKLLLQKKFNRLVSLNNLMKNINSAATTEELANLTLSTLNISFGIKSGIFALYDNEKFEVIKSLNLENCPASFKLSDKFSCLKEGDYFIINSNEKIPQLLDKEFAESIKNGAGALFVPICIEDAETKLLGLICVFELSNAILSDQESLLTVDTIANHIAPVLYHLLRIKNQAELLTPNHEKIFLNALEKHIQEAEDLFLDLTLIHIHNPDFSFEAIDVPKDIKDNYKDIYFLTKSDVFVVAFEKADEKTIRDLVDEKYLLSFYRYKKDFSSLEEFMNLFK